MSKKSDDTQVIEEEPKGKSPDHDKTDEGVLGKVTFHGPDEHRFCQKGGEKWEV